MDQCLLAFIIHTLLSDTGKCLIDNIIIIAKSNYEYTLRWKVSI